MNSDHHMGESVGGRVGGGVGCPPAKSLPQVTDCLPLSHWYKYQVTECDRSDVSPDWEAL